MSNAYTVAQINRYIQNMFEQDYLLHRVLVKGEVSNCKYHNSGHIYFSLKDESGTLACVMFAGQRKGLSFAMRDGDQLVVTGQISVYVRDGRYQLYANKIERDGLGVLYERFLKLKETLGEMGMFDASYKKPIPPFAMRIGIVTAPVGAAIRDIENIARRRNPFVRLVLCPAKVQGEGAAASIAEGIRRLSAMDLDVLIVGRGGGSIEDLWAFNEEEVARAIFECPVPVISAVGHETDTTIADFVADMRAPTPSAAAELAVFSLETFDDTLRQKDEAYRRALKNRILSAREQAGRYDRRLLAASPKAKLREKKEALIRFSDAAGRAMEERLQTGRQYLADTEGAMRHVMEKRMLSEKHRLELFSERVHSLSPEARLRSGYVYLEGADRKGVRSIQEVHAKDPVSVYLIDGSFSATVSEVRKDQGIKEEQG